MCVSFKCVLKRSEVDFGSVRFDCKLLIIHFMAVLLRAELMGCMFKKSACMLIMEFKNPFFRFCCFAGLQTGFFLPVTGLCLCSQNSLPYLAEAMIIIGAGRDVLFKLNVKSNVVFIVAFVHLVGAALFASD